jgi:hypothetical protein
MVSCLDDCYFENGCDNYAAVGEEDSCATPCVHPCLSKCPDSRRAFGELLDYLQGLYQDWVATNSGVSASASASQQGNELGSGH